MLYTQVDRLIMLACAERVASAPTDTARLGLAKQVGDESRHVTIQRDWMTAFGTGTRPVLSDAQEAAILAHFRQLDWLDFLTDMYLCLEALGSDAVERIVPLADPGTRESLQVPLADELDHIAFGIQQLRQALSELPSTEREARLAGMPERINRLNCDFHALGLDLPALFAGVGADYTALCRAVLARKDEVLQQVSLPQAA
jgi:hypothetical protein